MFLVGIAFCFFTGCISIGTYQRNIRKAVEKEDAWAAHLAHQVKDGDITSEEMYWLLMKNCGCNE